MPIFRLDERLVFPPPEMADRSGLLAVGGDLRPERLLLAYSMGIFPWYHEDTPILWHAPDPRAVLEPRALHVSRSLVKAIKKQPFELRLDSAFEAVMRACAEAPRPGQDGTWITDDMVHAYCKLHQQGHAHSIEAWQDGELVGGLYGVALGAMFFGESMFALVDDASKIAFVALVRQLARWGFQLIDCQQKTAHLTRFGAVQWSRAKFMKALAVAIKQPGKRGAGQTREKWRFDDDIAAGLL